MPVNFIFNNSKLRAWMLLHQTYSSVLKCEDKRLAPVGLTTQQHAILMAIKYTKAPATPTQIADWVDRHLNSITLILDRMEKNGLVKRVRNDQDRRSISVMMTEKGEKYLSNGTSIGAKLVQEMLSCLSDEEIKSLADLLAKVRTNTIEQCYDNKEIKAIDLAKNM